TVFFAFQIYCDFSGYSDIAIGAARTMGFDLMKNFDSPYFSKSITEFWRRWHISLSTWFRDYVYIPLGGSRNGKYRTYANLFIVFLVSGLWHGAAMTFVIWGAIHGVIIVIEKAFIKQRKIFFKKVKIQDNLAHKIIFIPLIFTIVCFAWIFFRANSLNDSFTLIHNIGSNSFKISDIYNLGLIKPEFIVSIITIILLVVFEWTHKRQNIQHLLSKQVLPIRWSFYLVVVFTILIFGIYGENQVSEFIYFQF
ncbi:MAG TPA: membrane-bound O-acyltransferase family protein, partial [Xanthomarina gelatinilytica]|nr:membrane-bound O-acyltransferase family protein [Xanthomarina gelatinilytica]